MVRAPPADGRTHLFATENGNSKQKFRLNYGKNHPQHSTYERHTFDVVLCLEGYDEHYAAHFKSVDQTSEKNATYWKGVVDSMSSQKKITAATSAVYQMKNADDVPKTVRWIIQRAIQLAGGE